MSALRIPIGTTYVILPMAAVFAMLFTVVKMFERIVSQSSSKGRNTVMSPSLMLLGSFLLLAFCGLPMAFALEYRHF